MVPDPEHAANLTDPHAALSGHIATMDLLVLAQDEATIHVWAHAAAGAPITLPDKEIAPGWRVAMGSPHAGCEGFVATHGEALSAQRVAHLARAVCRAGHGIRTIAAVSFLAENPERGPALGRWTLGALAAPGEEMHRLRETLASHLALGENAAAAGERLFLHRNTVAYRVARAAACRPDGTPTRSISRSPFAISRSSRRRPHRSRGAPPLDHQQQRRIDSDERSRQPDAAHPTGAVARPPRTQPR